MADAAHLLSPAPAITTKSYGTLNTTSAVDLTAVDGGRFAPFARKIFVGGAGVVRLKMIGDTNYTPYTCTAGQTLIGAFISIDSTANGTTATLLCIEQ